jgi:hypothetical protein
MNLSNPTPILKDDEDLDLSIENDVLLDSNKSN